MARKTKKTGIVRLYKLRSVMNTEYIITIITNDLNRPSDDWKEFPKDVINTNDVDDVRFYQNTDNFNGLKIVKLTVEQRYGNTDTYIETVNEFRGV
mgnify:FL=1|tara:strand:+ start:1006 stop:1293 length:288 start_codon:yes stop_codon:yes gene_type:complete